MRKLSGKTGFVFLFLASMILSNSCGVIEQVGEMKAFSRCEFRLASVSNIALAGLNIEDMDSYSDLGLMDAAMITTAVAKGELPLSFTLNIDMYNPNDNDAALNKLDWILYIDDIEMLSGTTDQRILINPGATTQMPLKTAVNLMDVLSGKSPEAIMNFGFNLAGVGNRPTRFMLKARPTIMVGNTPVSYPGYITVRQEFTSG